MQKLFEVAGSGCVPIVDALPELEELGYVDGGTAVTYANFDELAEKLRDYADRPEDLAAMGRATVEMTARRHTWNHRAAELETLLDSLVVP
jgi:spore maturation protein CgeB